MTCGRHRRARSAQGWERHYQTNDITEGSKTFSSGDNFASLYLGDEFAFSLASPPGRIATQAIDVTFL